MKKSALTALTLALYFTGCGSSDNTVDVVQPPVLEVPPPEEVKATPGSPLKMSGTTTRRSASVSVDEINSLTQGNNEFALSLYQQLNVDNNAQNIVFSPHSISVAFSMLYAGSANETSEELVSTFHYDLPFEEHHQAFNTLDQKLTEAAKDENFQLSIVNAQWGEKSYPFNADYVDTLGEFYGADLFLADFVNLPDKEREYINNWVAIQTNDLIKDLLPEGSINNTARFVLTNAVYFKASWETPFPAEKTLDRTFYFIDKSEKQIPTMQLQFNTSLYQTDGQTIVELPYKNTQWSMYLLHTDVSNFHTMDGNLTASYLDEMIDKMEMAEIDLRVPKFSFMSGLNLQNTLKKLGLNFAFAPSQADFSLMNENNEMGLFVQGAFHKAFMEVNEEGTEAGAATGLVVGTTLAALPVFLNSPFVFVIRHKETGAILFMGKVLDPIS